MQAYLYDGSEDKNEIDLKQRGLQSGNIVFTKMRYKGSNSLKKRKNFRQNGIPAKCA